MADKVMELKAVHSEMMEKGSKMDDKKGSHGSHGSDHDHDHEHKGSH